MNRGEEWSKGSYLMLVESVPRQVAQAGDTVLFHFDHPYLGQSCAVEVTEYGKKYEEMTIAERAKLREGRGAGLSHKQNFALSAERRPRVPNLPCSANHAATSFCHAFSTCP